MHSAIESRLKDSSGRYSSKYGGGVSLFLSEFGILVLPLLLSMTLFAARPLLLGLMITLFALLLIVLKPSHLAKSALLPTPTSHSGHALSRPSSPPPTPTHDAPPDVLTQDHSHQVSTVESLDHSSTPVELRRKFKSHMVLSPVPYLTIYRSHMILMTIIAILAVDFPVFPRYLAKCESFGVSLVCAPLFPSAKNNEQNLKMDLGVGSFVFAQGLVAAIPLIKDPNYVSAATFPKIVKATKKVLPLLALGLARVLFVKGTAYPVRMQFDLLGYLKTNGWWLDPQEHVTEYGVHWNFFITMGLLAPLSVLLHPVIEHFSIALVALSLVFGE